MGAIDSRVKTSIKNCEQQPLKKPTQMGCTERGRFPMGLMASWQNVNEKGESGGLRMCN